jgi:thymidylate synthase (FAD)
MRQASGNKQAGAIAGAATLTVERAQTFRERLIRQYKEAEALYQESLEMGVPKELARVGLPVGRYSRMRASASLRNWLGFMTLRCDPAAQEEIRLYSWALFVFLKHAFPRTMALFAPSVLGNPEQHDLEYITGKKQLRLSVGAFGDTYHVRVGATRQERSNG